MKSKPGYSSEPNISNTSSKGKSTACAFSILGLWHLRVDMLYQPLLWNRLPREWLGDTGLNRSQEPSFQEPDYCFSQFGLHIGSTPTDRLWNTEALQ